MIKNLKIILKKNHFIFNLCKIVMVKIFRLNRVKDVALMFLFFNILPRYTYLFSTRKVLPSLSNRVEGKKIFMPYEILKGKSKIKKFNTVNVISHGSSFNLNKIKSFKGKIIVAQGWESLRIDKKGNILSFRTKNSNSEFDWSDNNRLSLKNIIIKKKKSKFDVFRKLNIYKNKNIIYSIARERILKKYISSKKNKMNFIAIATYNKFRNKKLISNNKYWESKRFKKYFLKKNFFSIALLEKFFLDQEKNSSFTGAPSGSTLPLVYALSQISKKVNVYGWDWYFEQPVKKMSYLKFLFSQYNYLRDVNRSNNDFESGIYNLFYINELSKLPNVKIYGHLSNVGKQKIFLNKAKKVLFA